MKKLSIVTGLAFAVLAIIGCTQESGEKQEHSSISDFIYPDQFICADKPLKITHINDHITDPKSNQQQSEAALTYSADGFLQKIVDSKNPSSNTTLYYKEQTFRISRDTLIYEHPAPTGGGGALYAWVRYEKGLIVEGGEVEARGKNKNIRYRFENNAKGKPVSVYATDLKKNTPEAIMWELNWSDDGCLQSQTKWVGGEKGYDYVFKYDFEVNNTLFINATDLNFDFTQFFTRSSKLPSEKKRYDYEDGVKQNTPKYEYTYEYVAESDDTLVKAVENTWESGTVQYKDTYLFKYQ